MHLALDTYADMIRLIVTGRRGAVRHYKGNLPMSKQVKAIKIDATKLNALSKAAFEGEKSFGAEVEALKAVAVNGAIPKPYADAYKTAVVCAMLGLTRTKANLAEAAKPEHKAQRLAAANRLSRRVKAAGIKAANASGRKRGAQIKAGKTAKVASADAPSMPKATAPAVPTLANTAEAMMWLQGEVARIETVARKNAKSFTTAQHNAIAALRASVKTEPNH
jgi:hypothetical protein